MGMINKKNKIIIIMIKKIKQNKIIKKRRTGALFLC